MGATDAIPVPKKNTAYRHYFAIRKNDGTLITTWAGQDSEVDLDAAGFTDCTNEATESGTSGCGYIDLTAAEMNASAVMLKVTVTNTDALPYVVVLFPEEAGDIRAAATMWNGVALATTNPLPNAAPNAALGMIISTAGGFDPDTITPALSTISAIAIDVAGLDGAAMASGFAVAGDAMTLANASIKAATYDATGAFPLAAVDSGATALARTGADSDTLETLSDQIDGVYTGGNITGNLSGSVGSVSGAVGSVTGAVGSVTGNVGGNVVGSVGSVAGAVASVTGAVGSVTGNVGGNVVGTVASVVGAVGSVTGAVTVGTNSDKTGYALTAAERNSIADAYLDRSDAIFTGWTPRQAIKDMLTKTIGDIQDSPQSGVAAQYLTPAGATSGAFTQEISALGNRTFVRT